MRRAPVSGLRMLAILVASFIVAIGFTSLTTATTSERAAAADLRAFDPGYIISDENFFNSGSMDAQAVQRFLESKVSRCGGNGLCLREYRQDTWTRAADRYCSQYSGGVRESAADIIAKVARACGINPQVLLATLQKEQGIVTDPSPTSGEMTIAMGYACPDTAPCDTQYYGFYNQVYSAARQFKVYQLATTSSGRPYFTAYAPGGWRSVRFSPNAACGSSAVFIQNQATANLYYYTPYQPNAAALANEYAFGDTCSAYGNRNFFSWYSDWFGSPTVSVRGEINDYWRSLGGALGVLGAPERSEQSSQINGGGRHQAFRNAQVYVVNGRVLHHTNNSEIYRHWAQYGGENGALGWPQGNEQCGDGRCSALFGNGVLGWTSATGVHSITGARAANYIAQGGASARIGIPTGPGVWSAGNGGGWLQQFSNGTMYAAGSSAGVWFNPDSLIGAEYRRVGAVDSALGWPTGLEECRASGCSAVFQKGVITWSSSLGVQVHSGTAGEAYLRAGGPAGELGLPAGPARTIDGGMTQEFAGGTVYARAGGNAVVAMKASLIHAKFLASGGIASGLGWPTSDEDCRGERCVTQYRNGVITWSAATGAHPVVGVLVQRYAESGGPDGKLGLPTADARASSAGGGGSVQTFIGGLITASAAGSSFAFSDSLIHRHWATWGGESGELGWPVTSERCANATCSAVYVNGALGWSASTGVHSISGARYRAYSQYGGIAGPLGIPAGPANWSNASGGGWVQSFAGGTGYTTASGSTAFSNRDSRIHARYLELGGPASRLGWQLSNEQCASGTCSTRYSNGVLTWTAAAGVRG